MSGNRQLGHRLRKREKNATEAGAGRCEKLAPAARAAPPEAHESLIGRKTVEEVPLTGLSSIDRAILYPPGEAAMGAARIRVLPYAASDRRERVTFEVTGTAGSAIATTGMEVEAAPLDEVLADAAPTFIEMDIEGAEPRALAGATNIMRRHKPTLAVCLYHDRLHLWDIPLQIAETQPDYTLRLRRYADECWELVCYATRSH